jgi:hypothetical protein
MSALAASDIAAQKNVSFEGNCGSDRRAFETSKMTHFGHNTGMQGG